MSDDMDIFTCFNNSLITFLTGHNITPKNCRIIRKYDKELNNRGDLSFPSLISPWKAYLSSTENIEENLELTILNYAARNFQESPTTEELIKESQKWSLHINSCKIQCDLVILTINREHCFMKTLNEVFQRSDKYGRCSVGACKSYSVKSKTEEEKTNCMDLTTLREKILKEALEQFLVATGYSIANGEDGTEIYVSSTLPKGCKDFIYVQCGPVISSTDGKKNTTITAESYYSKREMEMRLMAEHKYGVRASSISCYKDCISKLGTAAVTIDLLQNKPGNPIKLSEINSICSNNKGAAFILYNGVRLATIIKKFYDGVTKGTYSNLPSLESVDFSLLIEPEEWELLYNYVLFYPVIVKSCIEDVHKGKFNPQYLCSFLSGMSLTFSVYYRRIRVLTPPIKHLLPVMYARIYFLVSLQQVLQNGLHILNLESLKEM